VENHDVVDAVQKLGFETRPQLLQHRFANLLFVAFSFLDLA
jgi:hypothetical protein